MHTKVLVILCAVAARAGYVEEAGENSHFRKVGEVALIVERADLIVDAELDSIDELVDRTCAFAEAVFEQRNLTVPIVPIVRTKFKYLCQEDRAAWDALAERVNGLKPILDRERRFVVTALLSALAGGVASELWGRHEDRTKVAALAKEQGRLMHIVDDLDARAAVDERHLKELGETLGTQEEMLKHQEKLTSSAIAALGSFALVGREIEHFSTVLSTALEHGRASPRLFRAGALREQLKQLRRQVQAQGLQLDMEDEREIWDFPVSFGTFSSRVLRIVIHIPVTRAEQPYHLLEYMPVPWKVKGFDGFGVAACPSGKDKIAVDGRGSQFFDPHQMDLVGSSVRRGYWRTSSPITTRRDSRTSCLWSMFKGRAAEVLRTCNLHTPPDETSFYPTGDSGFLAFNDKERRLDVWCKNERVDSVTFTGLKKLNLKPGCFVRGAEVFLTAPRHTPVATRHVKGARIEFDLKDLGEWIRRQGDGQSAKHEFLSWLRAPGRKLLHAAAEHQRRMAEATEAEDWITTIIDWIWDHPLAAGAIALLLLSGTFFMGRRLRMGIRSSCRKSRRSAEHDEQSDDCASGSSSALEEFQMRQLTSSRTQRANPGSSENQAAGNEAGVLEETATLFGRLCEEEKAELLAALRERHSAASSKSKTNVRIAGN